MRNPRILPSLLYPNESEVESLARAETDAERYPRFTPLAAGLLLNAAFLLLLLAAAAVTTPFRLVWRLCFQRGDPTMS